MQNAAVKHISIVANCFNEEQNVGEMHERVRAAMRALPGYTYEHIFIDNASTDRTRQVLRDIAAKDPNVKLIFNSRNFGQIRSARHGMLEARGDAVITMVSDLQDPPEVLPEFIRKWEEGRKIVIGVRPRKQGLSLTDGLRKVFYALMGRLSDVDLVNDFSGFGLYDRQVMDAVAEIDNPYFRGLICDIGFERTEVLFDMPKRQRGITKHNFYTLYDMALGGVTHHSKAPLRLATMTGFALAALCLLTAAGYLIYKLVRWDLFTVGITPLVVGVFFMGAVQLIFIGIIGEYAATIHTQVLRHPLLIEREKINFEGAGGEAVSVVTVCRNAGESIPRIYEAVRDAFKSLPGRSYEHIFVDRASTDNSAGFLRDLAAADQKVRVVFSARDFGQVRTDFYGIVQGGAEAVVLIGEEVLHNPGLIAGLIRQWELGHKIVLAAATPARPAGLSGTIVNLYYKMIERFAEADLIRDFSGVGLFDRKIIELLRQVDDPYPYLAGWLGELGFPRAEVDFERPSGAKDRRGVYSKFDWAMLKMTNHSKVPLRLAAMLGGVLSAACFLIGLGYLAYKLAFWGRFPAGIAPLVIGFFFMSSVQLACIGIIGEYIGNIFTQVKKLPRVVEQERVNF